MVGRCCSNPCTHSEKPFRTEASGAKNGRLVLVDLAGSENVQRSGADEATTAVINQQWLCDDELSHFEILGLGAMCHRCFQSLIFESLTVGALPMDSSLLAPCTPHGILQIPMDLFILFHQDHPSLKAHQV